MSSPKKTLHTNIKSVTQAMLLALGIITTRLIYLQVKLSDYFSYKSIKNFQRILKTPPIRGNIVDRNGLLLATNRPATDLYWQGSGNKRLNREQTEKVESLTSILNSEQTNDLYNSIVQAERRHQQILLSTDLSFDQISKIEERFPQDKNIILITRYARYYPYKTYASHILGYLGTINMVMRGKMGLEMLLENQLKGEYGEVLKTINSLGIKLSEQEIKKSFQGNVIQTTIDISLQQICEEVFPKEYDGAMIILDPHDGSIQALVSRPSFDPTLFLHPISIENWNKLQEKKPFINRVFNATYPPGSIFKLIVVSAALEQGIITPRSTWKCNGFINFGKRKYWCNRRYGHGVINTYQAVAKSCNILFYEIGKKIDIDIIADYAKLFGLGKKTGVMFKEQKGIIPSKAWKLETIGEQWWPGETLSVSIGQSFLSVTPIQIAQMVSAVFSKTLITPRILMNEPIQCRELDIKSETLDFLQRSMRAVVTKGTGQRVSQVKNIEIYAKTSTAQVSSLNKRHLDKTHLEHGWFVAYFRYKDYAPLTTVILIEHAGSSRLPTITAKNFLIRYKQYKDNCITCDN